MDDVGSNGDLQTITEANNLFTFYIYKALATEQGNLLISPLSIQVMLALVFLGARGRTASQTAWGLHLPASRIVVENGANALINCLKDNNAVTLIIANKIYLRKGLPVKDYFRRSLTKFMTEIEEINFGDENIARKTINEWVERETNNKIKDLVPQGILDAFCRIVLVNAIYFSGDWLKKFDKNNTLPMTFHTGTGKITKVDMMYIKENFKYADISELSSQILLLPYKGNQLSMMIVLPRDANGLDDLENKLTDINLQEDRWEKRPNFNFQNVTSRLRRNIVHLYLPKFNLTFSKELNEALMKLGFISIFSRASADLIGISHMYPWVTNVLHQSSIEVNEEGTEAAATDVIEVMASSVGNEPPPSITFKADHPFLFFILDQQTNIVFFMGRYRIPSA